MTRGLRLTPRSASAWASRMASTTTPTQSMLPRRRRRHVISLPRWAMPLHRFLSTTTLKTLRCRMAMPRCLETWLRGSVKPLRPLGTPLGSMRTSTGGITASRIPALRIGRAGLRSTTHPVAMRAPTSTGNAARRAA